MSEKSLVCGVCIIYADRVEDASTAFNVDKSSGPKGLISRPIREIIRQLYAVSQVITLQRR